MILPHPFADIEQHADMARGAGVAAGRPRHPEMHRLGERTGAERFQRRVFLRVLGACGLGPEQE